VTVAVIATTGNTEDILKTPQGGVVIVITGGVDTAGRVGVVHPTDGRVRTGRATKRVWLTIIP